MISRRVARIVIGGVVIANLCAGGAALYASAAGVEIKLNESHSLPRGLYVRTGDPIMYGSLVWFRLPGVMNEYFSTVEMRGEHRTMAEWYAAPGNGELKPVVGMEGDTICRQGVQFSINGKHLGDALLVGPSLWWLPRWEGCRTLASDELAVFSDRIPDSVDSRYYGAIKRDGAMPYRPWLVESPR